MGSIEKVDLARHLSTLGDRRLSREALQALPLLAGDWLIRSRFSLGPDTVSGSGKITVSRSFTTPKDFQAEARERNLKHAVNGFEGARPDILLPFDVIYDEAIVNRFRQNTAKKKLSGWWIEIIGENKNVVEPPLISGPLIGALIMTDLNLGTHGDVVTNNVVGETSISALLSEIN